MIDKRPIEDFYFTQEEYDAYQRGEEIWKDIPDWEGIYKVSTKGRIYVESRYMRENFNPIVSKPKIMKPYIGGTGYYEIKLTEKDKRKSWKIHRAQCTVFLKNPNNKQFVNHIDGVKLNINLSNLEWVTPGENVSHAIRIKLIPNQLLGKIGEKAYRSKKVFQYTLDGVYVNTFFGCYEAMRSTGIRNTRISECALGKIAHAGGFKWSYIKID